MMKLNPLCSAISFLLFSSTAVADVTLESHVSVVGSGTFSMINSSGKQTIMVSGERARLENRMESESKMMASFASKSNQANIVRADNELFQTLLPEKKQYSEMTFAEMRAAMERNMQQLAEVQSSGGLPVEDDNCEWSEPDMQVKKTGEKAKFVGISARQTLIEATQTCTDRVSGSQCKMTWNLEYWVAKKMPARKEIDAFTEGMAKALGGDDQLSLVKLHASGLMGMFKRGWDDILEESGDLKGFPVKTVMSLQMGGELCKMPSGQAIAMDGIWSEAANAGLDAAAGSAAGHAGTAIQQETAEALGDSVGGSIAGSAVGAASQKLLSGAFSKFKNRGKKEKQAEAPPANPAAGDVTLFKVTSELVDYDERDLADSNFSVPEGWKRVEASGW